MTFTPEVLWPQKDLILAGVQNTIVLTGLAGMLSLALGFLGALAQKMALPLMRWCAKAYVAFFRNTPLLIQLYFFYKALPQCGVTFTPMQCGLLALSLQSGAYMAEIFRGSIESIPKEQLEAGLSLGLTRLRTYWMIILPQALRVLMPPLGNQFTSLIKNSSLVAFITVPDLFFVVYTGGSAHFQYLEYFLAGICIYIGLNLAVSVLFSWIEAILPRFEGQQQVQYA